MIGYASHTGTLSTLRTLRETGWRLFVTPVIWSRNGKRPPRWDDGTRAPFALDNGAWSAFTQNREWDPELFNKTLDTLWDDADFVCVPDVVGDRALTLELAHHWLPRIGSEKSCFVVQDGMATSDLESLGGFRFLAIGGTTDWKLKNMRVFCQWALDRDIHPHVLRVNTMRRIFMASHAGAKSFDGSGPSRFPVTIGKLNRARHQLALFGGKNG
tara:strand:+ start:1624 stop:2265 length:642 start_codon:yes stop_codon:yes gene_type:complete